MINGLTLGSVYAIVALGYTMVYGIIQLINFAHGEVVMIGAMVAYTVIVTVTGAHTGLPPIVVVLAALLIAIPVCMAVGYTLERVAYRPLRKRGAPKLAFLISAIGASFFLATLIGKLFNSQTSNQFPPFFDANAVLFSIDGAPVLVLNAVIIISAVIMMVFLDRLVNLTKLGRSIRAVS